MSQPSHIFIPEELADDESLSEEATNPGDVDVTLIRWMLSLTLEERLDVLQSHAQAITELRDAIEAS